MDFAPQNAVRDAYNELSAEASKKDSLQSRLMGIFGGGDERQAAIARVMGRLEDDLRPDTGADAALGEEAVRRDNHASILRFRSTMISVLLQKQMQLRVNTLEDTDLAQWQTMLSVVSLRSALSERLVRLLTLFVLQMTLFKVKHPPT